MILFTHIFKQDNLSKFYVFYEWVFSCFDLTYFIFKSSQSSLISSWKMISPAIVALKSFVGPLLFYAVESILFWPNFQDSFILFLKWQSIIVFIYLCLSYIVNRRSFSVCIDFENYRLITNNFMFLDYNTCYFTKFCVKYWCTYRDNWLCLGY